MITKVIRISGWILLLVGAGLILMGAIGIGMKEGVASALYLFNPFNIVSFVFNIITLAPGLGLLWWAERRV